MFLMSKNISDSLELDEEKAEETKTTASKFKSDPAMLWCN